MLAALLWAWAAVALAALPTPVTDSSRIAKAAPAIKPPFARAYAAFGVFPQ
jgi:hypothetical protein